MRFAITRSVRWSMTCAAVLLVSISITAQESLEQRLAALEARARRADVLEARVKELESRLEETEADELEARLADSIDGLLPALQEDVVAKSRLARGLVIGGQLRQRGEYRTVSLYGAPDPAATDEDIFIQRTRVNFDARVLDDVRVFVEIQDSRFWGEEQTVLTDLMGVDLHQGYADFENIFDSSFTVRTGRFELALWNQRLISPLDWHPVGRAWDGVLVFGEPTEGLTLHAGYHLIAEGASVDSDKDTDLYWGSATYTGIENHRLGAAFFWLHSNTGSADFSFGTATVHAQGRFGGGFDYSVDLVAQVLGEVETADVEAYATAIELGYTFDADWKPRIAIEWTWASGDDDPTDGEFGTFNPLFPFQHKFQGYLDIFAWRNGHDFVLHLQARPNPKWWLELAFHGFWLDDSDDSWYGAAGTPIRTSTTTNETHVGWELDISVKHWLADNVWLWFGYSHFFAGDYVEDTGRSPDADWFWCQLTVDF